MDRSRGISCEDPRFVLSVRSKCKAMSKYRGLSTSKATDEASLTSWIQIPWRQFGLSAASVQAPAKNDSKTKARTAIWAGTDGLMACAPWKGIGRHPSAKQAA